MTLCHYPHLCKIVLCYLDPALIVFAAHTSAEVGALQVAPPLRWRAVVRYLVGRGYTAEALALHRWLLPRFKTLHWAAGAGNMALLRHALERIGRNPEHLRIALEYASRRGQLVAVEYLLGQGARPTTSALYLAQRRGHGAVVSLLVPYVLDHRVVPPDQHRGWVCDEMARTDAARRGKASMACNVL